jgi:hypothetical protein
MNNQGDDKQDGSFTDLILILQSILNDDDKFWAKNKDWLLDDEGNKVSL